jgi:hypothetical protein
MGKTSPTGSIVLTTIYESSILAEYHSSLEKYGHLESVGAIVIPDKKTPRAVFEQCAELRRRGWNVQCPSLEEQEEYLGRLGGFKHLVPYNSDNRRNIGFLMALEQQADYLISIDDDNFPLPDSDFVREHAVVCADEAEFTVVESDSGWFNICEMLCLEPDVRVYPRGFPYNQRHKQDRPERNRQRAVVRMNAGLWLSEPDLDAMTWLIAPVRATDAQPESVVLGRSVWSPINTQNTSLHRDVIPSYYFVRMNYPMAGMPIDRYGDIFSGYFSQACVRHIGHSIRVGSPVANHLRNSHNYMADVTKELACIWTLEDVTGWLQNLKLDGARYSETYLSLSEAIDDAVEKFTGFIWTDTTRGYFHQTAYCMRKWVEACRVLGAR